MTEEQIVAHETTTAKVEHVIELRITVDDRGICTVRSRDVRGLWAAHPSKARALLAAGCQLAVLLDDVAAANEALRQWRIDMDEADAKRRDAHETAAAVREEARR